MHVYIWFQYCSHSNIPCMEINWSWEPPPARKLARVQVKTKKLMRVSWRVQVAHNPVLVVTVDTVKALQCWFDTPIRTRNRVTDKLVQNRTVLYDLVPRVLLAISVVLPATESVFLWLVTRVAVPMAMRVTVAVKQWALQTTIQGACMCVLEEFTACAGFGHRWTRLEGLETCDLH